MPRERERMGDAKRGRKNREYERSSFDDAEGTGKRREGQIQQLMR